MAQAESNSPGRRSRTKLPFRLSICGKSEADGFAGRGVTHILSLEDPQTPKRTPAWFRGVHWQLQFHDVESAEEAQMLGGRAVTPRQVQAILDCGQQCLKASATGPVHLLVHCGAGISRSTAAAYVIAASVLGSGHELEALRLIRRLRPEAFPNLLVVQQADRLLGRNGQLVSALALVRPCEVDDWMPWVRRPAQQPAHWDNPDDLADLSW